MILRVVTPAGTFQMTKSEFYREFKNVVGSKSYSQDGIYNYPQTAGEGRAISHLIRHL